MFVFRNSLSIIVRNLVQKKSISPSLLSLSSGGFGIRAYSSTTLSRCQPLTKTTTVTFVSRRRAHDFAKEGGFNRHRPQEQDGIPAGGWFLLVIPVSTLCLGIWQVYRWRWKLGLIDEMRLKSIADPVPLPEDLSTIEQLDYQKVKVHGTFDYSKEVLIGPRSLVPYADPKTAEQGRGIFSSSSAQNNGYHVITPFKIADTNEVILVNRGWIPSRNPKDFKHIEGPVNLIGIVRKNEPRAPFMSKNRPGQVLFHYRDVPTMAALLGAEEVFLDLHSLEGIDFSKARSQSIPVPQQTRVTLRNEHVSYFITWFSLSAITSLMWHRRFIKRLNLL